MRGLLKTEDLKKLAAELAKKKKVFGPVRTGNGFFLSELGPGDDPLPDHGKVRLPVKRRFFPQREAILSFETGGAGVVPAPEGEAVLFGVRPCDARSLTHLDRVFLDEQVIDPYYRRRRESSLILALACSEPQDTCFCTSMGGNPASREAVDVLAFRLEETVLMESCSEKGRAFMELHKAFFRKPTKAEIQAGKVSYPPC